MTAFTKHVGRNKNGTRLVVVFREIPGAEDHCLCVETDSLMEMYHDQLLREVNSREAQQTVNLYEVLERRHFGDGQQMLNGLHNKGLLRKYPVDQVDMVPMPNRVVPLKLVNSQIRGEELPDSIDVGGQSVQNPNKKAEAETPKADDSVVVDTERELQKTQTAVPPQGKDSKAVAEGKLLQARLMEEDAKKLREEAYSLDPDLKKGGRPSKKASKKAKAE